MKRFIVFAAVFAAAFARVTARADDITVIVNGNELRSDNEAVIVDDRTLVPMRAIFEALDARVSWDETDYRVYASRGDSAVSLRIGSDMMDTGIVNSSGLILFSSAVKLDVPARLIGDFTYVPVRAIAEALRENVNWDPESRRVVISDKPEGEGAFFYASADDYNKLYRTDSNGVRRVKLSDKAVKAVYYDSGYVYYISGEGFLYRQIESGGQEEQLTDYDTEVVSVEDGRIFCLKKTSGKAGELIEYGKESFGNVIYPEKHGSYIYFNRADDNRMHALNTDSREETAFEMRGGLTLSPFNCVFYGGYILVEDGYGYHNIYRFNADGSGMMYLNSSNSFICRNQEEDERILYINGDNGQDIYYVWIDGSYNGMLADMPQSCARADVLCQNGNYVYYKNMYHPEIYRADFASSESVLIGSGDAVRSRGDRLVISNGGLFTCGLDGSGMSLIYNRSVSDYFLCGSEAYAVDSEYGNIVRVPYNGEPSYVINDKASVWTDNFEER